VLPQHPDEHRPERPVLLAVDQELGEGPALWVSPELSDPIGPLEVGEHEDVEQLGAGSGAEGVDTLPEHLLKVLESSARENANRPCRPSHNVGCDHRQTLLRRQSDRPMNIGMGVCVGGSAEGPGRCFGWNTPVGLAVNVVLLMWWVAVVVFVIRFLWFAFREAPDQDDLRRFAFTGPLNRSLLVLMFVGAGVLFWANLAT
jgi:hypothetical protein